MYFCATPITIATLPNIPANAYMTEYENILETIPHKVAPQIKI